MRKSRGVSKKGGTKTTREERTRERSAEDSRVGRGCTSRIERSNGRSAP